MARQRRAWTRRQREQLRHLANYVDYLSEKVADYMAASRPIPELLREAVDLLPRIKQQIEDDDFISSAELWRELENRIVEWHLQESRNWKPPGPRSGSPPS